MRQIQAIYRRELNAYFKSPIGYVLLAIFVFVSSLFFAVNLLGYYANIATELNFMQGLFFVLIPILTMKTFAEERRSGTEILLFTTPVTTPQIVIGKYLAALTLFLIMTATTLIHVVITVLLQGTVDVLLVGTYVGFILSGAVYIAIGVLVSSMTSNQIIAAIVSVVIFIGFMLLDAIASLLGNFTTTILQNLDFLNLLSASQEAAAGQAVTAAVTWINPATRLVDFSSGIFRLTPIVFLISFTLLFLYLTVQVLERRRWTQS